MYGTFSIKGVSARILADSLLDDRRGYIPPSRLTTLEVTFPRFILAEFNTHRMFSRNSASSRAIPVQRQLELIESFPFIPRRFPINQPGMSATAFIDQDDPRYGLLTEIWLEARDHAVKATKALLQEKIHKQTANRLLEPFMYHTVIVSATDWQNFWDQRISPTAQPEMYDVATMMKSAYDNSTPALLNVDAWHLPLITIKDRFELSLGQQIRVSAARCAAVSYNRHTDRNIPKELSRYEFLARNTPPHLSPLEHPARASREIAVYYGNFRGWQQCRWYEETGFDLPE